MPYFENNGARLHYKEVGQGNPLVFLHGFGWDLRQWENEVEYFSSTHRVITLDIRGHGKSTLPQGNVSPDSFWKDVVALLDFLDIPSANLCGSSMGGHIALQVAINALNRVKSLILIGAICTNQFNRYERWIVPVNRFCQRLMPMSWIAWSISVGLGKFNKEARPYIREVVEGIPHDVYNRTWKAVTSMESRDGLAKIQCQTLILVGDHDSMTFRQQKYINNKISNSRLVIVKNAHHGTNFDNPEQVQNEIELFLQELS